MEIIYYKKNNHQGFIKSNKYLLAALILTLPVLLLAQAPNISYPVSQTFTLGKNITLLSPTNTGGVVPTKGYGQADLLAGGGPLIPNNGSANASTFANPVAIAADKSGNIYVASTYENVIRKITPGGVVTTFAGSGIPGSNNGTGTAASFNYPLGLASDTAGNLYVSDSGNNLIRKITPQGEVTTLAGSGLSGGDNAVGTFASFENPTGIATDAAGNVYVADPNNDLIRKIDPSGIVTTFAGSGTRGHIDGTGTAASFSYPNGLATDAAGNVYVADFSNNCIRKITPTGVVTTLAGSGNLGSNNGIGASATFNYPNDVATDALGNVYVVDQYNNQIRKIDPTGMVTTLAGSGVKGSANGNSASASFNFPNRLTADAAGNVYVADENNNLIRKIDPVGNVTTFAGSGAFGQVDGTGSSAYFSRITTGVSDASGNIYIADCFDNLIRKITPAGVVTTLAGSGAVGAANGTGTEASFYYPYSLALDAANNIYVADEGNNLIRKITPAGVVSTFAGNGYQTTINGTGTEASFNNPKTLTADAAGNIYVGEQTPVIRKIDPNGVVTTLAGSNTYGSADGLGAAASFSYVTGLALDEVGNLYASDAVSNLIRKITPNGEVTTLAGNGNLGSVDGVGKAASFANPTGIAVDDSGNIYVGDQWSSEIRKIDSKAVVTTLLKFDSNTNYNITGLNLDALGNLYVASNGTIYKIPLTGYTISPSLPLGLNIDAATGIISGIPIAVSPATNYTITAYNQYGSSSTTVSIAVSLPSAPIITYKTPQKYSVNKAITPLSPTNTGGAVPANTYGQVSSLSATSSTVPISVAVDAAGNVYWITNQSNLIQKITPSGVVSVFAGGLNPGSSDGQGTSASFNDLKGIAIDASGYFYVTDYGNKTIRKITPSGMVSTLAGTLGVAGKSNGTGTNASFNNPRGIATDLLGNIYVADNGNNLIRKITPAGVVTTLAGSGNAGQSNGTGTGASFNSPIGIATDAAGNVYVGDVGNESVRKIDPTGIVTTLAGNGTIGSANGIGTSASFYQPAGVATDFAGNVYVADAYNNLIRKIDKTGLVSTIAGNGNSDLVDGIGIAASFYAPYALANDGTGNLYVADAYTNVIRKVIITGYTISPALPDGLSFDATTGTINGTPNVVFPSTTFTVSAYNLAGVSNATFNLEVISSSNDASLSSLTISAGVLSPSFTSTTLNYNDTVSSTITSISLIPTTTDTNAIIKINGNVSISGTATVNFPLNFGNNIISIVVTAQDGTTTQTYTLSIIRPYSADASLYNLSISSGAITPEFNANTYSYTASVPYFVTNATVTPTATDVNSIIKVNGIRVLSGSASSTIPLNFGSNTIDVVVISQDNSTQQTYTLSVIRAAGFDATLSSLMASNGALSPGFSPATTTYATPDVSSNTNSITITPITTDPNATVTINGNAAINGSPYLASSLAFGNNVILVVVTAQDGIISQTYALNVNRLKSTDATLSSLVVSNGALSPGFSPATTTYATPDVSSNTNSITITPTVNNPNATVTVNGNVVASGASYTFTGLAFGINALLINVTAQDGVTTQAYTLTVNRLKNIDVTLSSLSISNGTLSPTFASNILNYKADVSNAISSITLTPLLSDIGNKITVNGIAVLSGTATANIPLSVGDNIIAIIVTAQDETTVQTYNLTVTRAASSIASLSNLTFNAGVLSPSFSSDKNDYTVTMSSTTGGITFTPTLTDVNATMHINGQIAPSGIPFSTNLNVSNNPIRIIVTAQDGITTQTYTIIAVNNIFTLPSTNYNITITGETCNGSSNGTIAVTAAANNNYTAVLSGNGVNTTQKFTSTATFNNLPVGTYTLTFTVDGQANYSNQYTLTVTQPQPLSVFATVNEASGNIELALNGGSVYHIQLNNKAYTTTENNFTVPLEPGNNALQVTTDRECQGVFTKLINPSFNISPYPMPFESTLNLNLGSSNIATVSVRIYSANTGLQVFTADYQNQSGVLQLDLSKLQKGAYGLQLMINNTKKEFKIIK